MNGDTLVLQGLRSFVSKVCWRSSYFNFWDFQVEIMIEFLDKCRTKTVNYYLSFYEKEVLRKGTECITKVFCFCGTTSLHTNSMLPSKKVLIWDSNYLVTHQIWLGSTISSWEKFEKKRKGDDSRLQSKIKSFCWKIYRFGRSVTINVSN